MDKKFSTVLRLKDIDDYITPSQNCIKPVKINQMLGRTKALRVEEDGNYAAVTEEGDSYTLNKVSITLNDCLACSGCITTAESVLISQHSCDVLREFLNENAHTSIHSRILVVVSISPQSLADLATTIRTVTNSLLCHQFDAWREFRNVPADYAFQLGVIRAFLADFLVSLGAHLTLDTTWARDITLKESGIEFVEKYNTTQSQKDDVPRSIPVLCGVCPGWICYAEKTHSLTGSASDIAIGNTFSILPYLSQIRSPQQIIGRLLKLNNPKAVFHVTVMPCFDKKLEASRVEFSSEAEQIPDVDLVLATNELVELISSCDTNHNWAARAPDLPPTLQRRLKDLKQLFQTLLVPVDTVPTANLGPPILYRHLGSGSGGYAAFVLIYAAAQLFDMTISDAFDDPRVIVRQLQNRDFQEILLFPTSADCDTAKQELNRLPSNRIPFRHTKLPQTALLAFAVANGFRNIQNLVQRLKVPHIQRAVRDSTSLSFAQRSSFFPFDYVEVMACPGGCLNGGGQTSASLDETRALYEELIPIPPLSTTDTQKLYDYLTQTDPMHSNLRTTYHQVPKMEIINPAALRW